MKIGFVYDAIYPDTIGGVEKRIYEIGTRLVRQGHEVHLFGMKYWNGPDIIVRDGLVLHGVMPACPLYVSGRRRIIPAIIYALHLIIPLLHHRMDLIECQNFPYFPCFTAKCISLIRRTPLVIIWHEFWGDYWYDYIGRFGFLGLIIERICVSLTPYQIVDAGLIADAMKRAGSSISPAVIPCGVDSSSIEQVAPSSIPSDIIFVGRLIQQKHPEMVVLAVALIKERNPGIFAIIIGDGPQKEEISGLIQKLDLQKNVTLMGFVPDNRDIIAYMKSSQVCVLPSEREGFGIVGIEAILCGLFFVTSDHPRNAAKELVYPWSGMVCDISPASVADAVESCLQRHDTGDQEQQEERIRFRHDHEWSVITEHTWDHYTRVLTLYHQ